MSTVELTELPSARDVGWLCGVAGQAQRDLQRCAQAHAELFPEQIFDSALFSTIALANTFAAPWLSASQLRQVNRVALWTFGLDRLVDTVSTTATAADSIVARCLSAVKDDHQSDRRELSADPLVTLLIEIHDDLREYPGYRYVGAVWRRELTRLLNAMAKERLWLATPAPTVQLYLDNADSLAVAFVFATHVVACASAGAPAQLDELFGAVRLAQAALRLVNDLATYERDVATGDLNVLRLGIGRAEVGRLIQDLVARCRQQVGQLAAHEPRLATHIVRQLEFNLAFYGVADYWRGY